MRFNKVLKGLAVALPLFTLAACSSNKSTEMDEYETNGGTVVEPVAPVAPTLTPEEIRNNELRQSQTVFFTFDDSEIKGQFKEMLGAHAAFLRTNPDVHVTIEGHADERGTPEYNIALGERRAKAVQMFLQAQGVPMSQLSIVSYGEERPLVLGHTEHEYQQNRRAVLVY
ncbi:MAG: peptidoglycan-associated lipoprotein Pal [Enterovibrio sp.]